MGIELEFRDAPGEAQLTDATTAGNLLSAMPADAREAQLTLRELERTEKRRLLPIVVVSEAGSRLEVPLTLPDGTINWAIQEKNGGTRAGEAPFSEFELLHRGKSDGHAAERCRLHVDALTAIAYRRLRNGGDEIEMALIVVPERCHVP